MIKSFFLFVTPLFFLFFFNFPCLGESDDINNFSASRPTKQKSQDLYGDLYSNRPYTAVKGVKNKNVTSEHVSFLEQQVCLIRVLLMPLSFDPSMIYFELFKR